MALKNSDKRELALGLRITGRPGGGFGAMLCNGMWVMPYRFFQEARKSGGSQAFQDFDMRPDGAKKGIMFDIWQVVFQSSSFDNGGQVFIMRMANLWEKMVFYLEIQPTE